MRGIVNTEHTEGAEKTKLTLFDSVFSVSPGEIAFSLQEELV